MFQKLKNYYHLLQAIAAGVVFGFPSKRLKIIAITGTDGKTTTATLIYHILKVSGQKVALISTVAAFIGDEEIDTGFHVTTPSSFALQALLKKIADRGYEYVVLEVTSHGIDQNRIWGIHPHIALITNVTHEHLDYHTGFAAYLATKVRLLLLSEIVFLNKDAHESFEKVKENLEASGHSYKVISTKSFSGKVKGAVGERFGTQKYNAENAALAVAVARRLHISDKICSRAIISFPGVTGRLQEIKNDLGIKIIVDFAHTPNALEKVLQAVQTERKLIVVFGCAGLRDQGKRPLMGEVATRLADFVVLTAEDPRTEDVWSIINQIKSGLRTGHGKISSIPDRFAAITFAIKKLAKKGDTVIITGKGHEKSMCFGSVEYPWSDQEAIKKIINNQSHNGQ